MSFDDIGFNITVERALDKLRNSNNIRRKLKPAPDRVNIHKFKTKLCLVSE